VATVKEIPANLPKHLPGRMYDRQFFFAITLLLVVVVAIGFGPTYYLAGVFRAPLPSRIVHIHGAVFSTWMILLVVQTGLISTGRVEWHRKLGVAGFVLACGMVLTVLLTAADFAMRAKAKPNSEALLTLLVVPFTDAAAFAVLAGLAYALRKNAAAHKRLIIIATAGLTRAALVRWHVPILFQHQHAAYTATYVFLVLLATYDLWSTRKIHRATIWGGVFLILMGQIGGFIGPTAPWHAFAHWVQSLGV
jgi:FtsH-binding integral membrane protein